MAQISAAASIRAIDALFGLVARNDAEWDRRELLGRTWRRDWAMRKFQEKNRNPRFVSGSGKKSRNRENFLGLDALGSEQGSPGVIFLLKNAHGPISTPSPSQKL